MGIKYLVTGAAGNLGSSVTRELLAQGRSVRALVLPDDPSVNHVPSGVEIMTGNILNKKDLKRFFSVGSGDESVVIHCASIVTTYWSYNNLIHEVNVEGTRNIVEQCIESKIKKLIYISSVHALPELPHGQTIKEITDFDPDRIIGFYGKTKAEASRIVMDAVKNRGLNASFIFPTALCGPNDYARGHITQMLIDGSRNKLPAGIKGGYDFVDVRDVAKGIVSCCDFGKKGEGYILGNRYVSVKEILYLLSRISGARLVKLMFPMWTVRFLIPFFHIYYKVKKRPPMFTRYSVYTLTSNSIFSSDKAKRELGYKVRPFEETIEDALMWLKAEKVLNK